MGNRILMGFSEGSYWNVGIYTGMVDEGGRGG